jgi:AICAR transformylase/IMP cyclohydrolase PurH
LEAQEGQLDYALRKKLACAAYTLTASYDTAISTWFQTQL